jgi:hypothetical protein
MSANDAPLRDDAGVSELVPSSDTVRVLREAEVDPHLAQVLAFIESELSDRLRSDAEDDPAVAVEERIARRYRLLGRMAARYQPDEGRCRLGGANTRLMLAVLHRLTCPARPRHL